jgi:hypothetical protein
MDPFHPAKRVLSNFRYSVYALKKRLTRRANQGHNGTIAKIVEPAR